VNRAAALLLLSLSVAVSACAGYRLVEDGRVRAGAVDALKTRLARVRELPFEVPVPVVTMSAAEARAMLERELAEDYAPGELERLSRVYRALGLLPEGVELEDAVLELYAGQLAGFYDPVRRHMVIVEQAVAGGPTTRILEAVLRRDLAGEMLLAHEMAHALQDQHFGIESGRGDLGEDDAQLARRAVYEGDATLAGFAAVSGRLGRRKAVRVAGRLQSAPAELARAYPDVPALVRETALFQYVAGTNFVSWAYRKAGWEGVNALLALPPRSTEQVLHPEKYFVTPEYPLTIRIGGLAPYERGDWPIVEETTLGELVIRILAERFFDRDEAARVAAGWDGDRLIALARAEEMALVWLTAWDSEDDAREFFAAYAEILARKRDRPPVAVEDDRVVASDGAVPYRLERQGSKILAIEGALEADLDELAARIWRRSRYDATLPWMPLDLARTGAH